MTPPPQERDFICFAHRGASGYAPENTIESFSKAIELGAAWIEFDIRVVEGTPIVFHDRTLTRLTGFEGVVEEQSLDTVRALQVQERGQIPLLRETLAILRGKAGAQIELKGPGSGKATAGVVSAELSQGWLPHNLLVSSFSAEELQDFHQEVPAVPVGMLAKRLTPQTLALAKQFHAYSIHLDFRYLTQEEVSLVQREGHKLFAYTVNRSEDLLRLYSLGVDGVFSDFPDRVISKSFL
jgi:glycerophosphoryl diester phosphodiesterase